MDLMTEYAKNRRHIRVTFCGFFFSFCLATALIPGCSLFDQAENKVVVVVGSRHITTEELKRDMEFVSAGMDIPVQQRDQIKDQLVGQVIEHYLILEYGREKGITISNEELHGALKDIKSEYTEDAFKEALLRGYVDLEEWKDRLRERLLVNKITKRVTRNIAPPNYQEIKEYFEANLGEFRSPRMLKFRQIVTRTREKADGLLKRLHDGEDMSELATKHSVGPEAEDGGEVGWVAEGQLDESMEKALLSLPQGRISPVTKTPYGYHIFEVLSSRPEGVKKLPQVVAEIESRLLYQKRQVFCKKWIQGLKTHYTVKVNRDLLNKLEMS